VKNRLRHAKYWPTSCLVNRVKKLLLNLISKRLVCLSCILCQKVVWGPSCILLVVVACKAPLFGLDGRKVVKEVLAFHHGVTLSAQIIVACYVGLRGTQLHLSQGLLK